jgi:hypothetical protein
VKVANIREKINECDWYVFEICSIKIYTKNGFQVQYELTSDYEQRIQTREELMADLYELMSLLPPNGKILFQGPFRLQVIRNDEALTIEKREIIYETLDTFCKENSNRCFLYDPSVIIKDNHSIFFNETHFTDSGHHVSFNYMYDNYFSKYLKIYNSNTII